MRRSLVANGGFDHRALFPRYFPKSESDATPDNAPEGAAYDYSEVTWKSPQESMDEFERLMGALRKSSSGVVSGDQLSARTWSEWQ